MTYALTKFCFGGEVYVFIAWREKSAGGLTERRVKRRGGERERKSNLNRVERKESGRIEGEARKRKRGRGSWIAEKNLQIPEVNTGKRGNYQVLYLPRSSFRIVYTLKDNQFVSEGLGRQAAILFDNPQKSYYATASLQRFLKSVHSV